MAKKRGKKGRGSRRGKRAGKKKGARRKKAVKRRSLARPKKRPTKKKARIPSRVPKLPSEPIGRVTHYFPKARATAILIERDGLVLGDTLYFKGHTTRFKQKVESLQIDRESISQASPGQEVGIRVKSRTREHDLVFKL